MSARASVAVLIGSGPSLNRIDVRMLAAFDTIAFNRSFLAWADWGFAPAMHACLDPASIGIIGPELPPVIAAHKATKFFLHSSAARIGIGANDQVTLCDLVPGSSFSDRLSPLTDFGNVGAVSMQVLQALGYRKILTVGVDGDYQPESGGSCDVNHFRDDYARGRVPLTVASRARYTAAWPAVALESARFGMDVRNASPGSALSCFENMDFGKALAWLRSDGPQARDAANLQGQNS